MAPATYLAVLFCAALAAVSVSAETLDEGKSLGQSLGASGAQQAPSVTESSATINSTLGHESTQGAGGGAGYDRGYTGAATYTGKLACAEGRTAFFGGLGLRVASCTVAGGNVTQLSLESCTSARDGVACQWSAPKTVLNPGSTSFGGFAVNLTCPAGGSVCDITVRETASQTWNADTLAEQGRQAAQAEGTGGFYDAMNTTYNDGGYRASLSAVGPQHSGCVEQVDAGLAADGIVYSCDGLQNASFDSACEETRECLRTEEQITRYAVDCVSGVDLVQQSCTTVTPTKDCEVSIEKQTYSCNKTLAVAATPNYNSWNCPNGMQLGPTYTATNGLGRTSLTLKLFCATSGRVRVEYAYTPWAYPNYNAYTYNAYLAQAKNSWIVERNTINVPITGIPKPPLNYTGSHYYDAGSETYINNPYRYATVWGNWYSPVNDLAAWSYGTDEGWGGRQEINYRYARFYADPGNLLSINRYRRAGYLWFQGSNCSGGLCMFNFKLVDEYVNDDSWYADLVKNFTVSFPAPVNYTYTDTWTDGCTTYENAK